MHDAVVLTHDANNPSPSSRGGVIRDPEVSPLPLRCHRGLPL